MNTIRSSKEPFTHLFSNHSIRSFIFLFNANRVIGKFDKKSRLLLSCVDLLENPVSRVNPVKLVKPVIVQCGLVIDPRGIGWEGVHSLPCLPHVHAFSKEIFFCFWAAEQKGTMSSRAGGEFPSIRTPVRLHVRPSIPFPPGLQPPAPTP